MVRKSLLTLCFSALALALAGQDLVYGVVDSKGRTVIPFEYQDIMPVHEPSGLYQAKKDGRWGAIDRQGNVVIPFRYAKRIVFYEDFATFKSEKGKSGVIDLRGNLLIDPEYQWISQSHGLILANYTIDSARCFDPRGRELLPWPCQYAFRFDEKMICVKRLDGKCGVIDTMHNVLMPFEYDEVWRVPDRHISLGRKNKAGKVEYSVYDTRLRKVTRNTYEEVFNFRAASPLLLPVRKDGKWGLIRPDGNDTEVLPFAYKSIHYWGLDGIALDFPGNLALLNRRGKPITPFLYYMITPSVNKKKWFFEARTNDLTEMQRIVGGEALNYDHTLTGCLNSKGKVVLPVKYKGQIAPINNNWFIHQEKDGNGTWVSGIIDGKGNVVMPYSSDWIADAVRYTDGGGDGSVRTYWPSRLPKNHVVIYRDSGCCIRDIKRNKDILSGVEEINGVSDGCYIVGKKRTDDL